ncbi:MAG: SLC13 family permease [Halanaerobiales bacterium]
MDFKKYIMIAGILISLVILLAPTVEGLPVAGKNAIAVFVFTLTLWVTNVIPLAVTSLLGMALIPLFGVLSPDRSFALFGNKAIFFILGALIMAAGIQKTGLGVRVAYKIISRFNDNPRHMVGGVMVTAASLSCIMPEHAVAALLFPVVIQIARTYDLKPLESNLGKCLFLALAWGAVIGGITTYLGGARNLLAVDILQKNHGMYINFFEWIKMSIPIPVVILTITYFILVNMLPPEEGISVTEEELGEIMLERKSLSRDELKLMGIVVIVIFSWLFFSRTVDISITAVLGGVAVFIFKIVSWNEIMEYVNWNVILMYGGAIVVASSLTETGAAQWFSEAVFSGLAVGPLIFIAVVSLITKVLTEGISNVAAVAIILPLSFSWGDIIGINPVLVTLSVALAGGLAFCLPMGTPPNAIAFSAGYYKIGDVVKIGVILNFISWIVVLLVSKFYWPLIGVDWIIQ